MKLILTAGAQLASIALFRRAASRGERTWAGKTMGRDGVVGGCGRQVLTAASFLRPGSSAWQAHHTSRSSNIDITNDVDDPYSTPPPPCPPSPGQLAPASSRPRCDPLRHALSPRHTAHTRPTRTFPTSTRRRPRMRPPSPSRATPPRSGRRVPLRASGTRRITTLLSTTGPRALLYSATNQGLANEAAATSPPFPSV